jgi:hypothetical protein
MVKGKNRQFLIKVQVVKIIFYPLIVLLDKTGLISHIFPFLERATSLLGMKKSINAFLQYRDYCSIFKESFRGIEKRKKNVIVFPAFFGANSNLTLFILLLARYYVTKGFHPVLFVCNSSVPVCQKENIIRTRRFNLFFCHECCGGYEKIISETGIEVQYIDGLKSSALQQNINKGFYEIERLDSLEKCRGYIYNDLPVGELAYKSLLRFELRGSVSDNYRVLGLYKKYLKSTLIVGLTFERLVLSRPDINRAVIHNGTLGFEAIIRHVCQHNGIPYMTFETYMGENTLVYKKDAEVMLLNWDNEMDAFYRLNGRPAGIEEEVEAFLSELKRGKHKYAVLNKTDQIKIRYTHGSFVVAFTNLNFDTTVIGRHSIFRDMEDWLVSLIRYWEKDNSGVKLVIRIHPAEVRMRTGTREFMGEKLKEHIRTNNILLIDSDETANAYDLIEQMEYGLVYSSTIGIEIASTGKACVVAGRPFYYGKPFVLTPSSQEEYFSLLSGLNGGNLNFKADRESLLRTIYYIFRVRLKELKGIKLFTLNADKNTEFKEVQEMVSANIGFLDEFEQEFSDLLPTDSKRFC